MAKVESRPESRTFQINTLKSFNPATGEMLGEVPVSTPEEVREAVAAARKAAPAWAALGADARGKYLGRVRLKINENLDRIVETVSLECGKPRAEALAHDIVPTLLTLLYYEKIAPGALRPERIGRFLGLLTGMSSRIEWRPFGVVGCISAWNYPFLLPFLGMVPALVAGNAVVLKPSEITPKVGELIAEMLEPLPAGVATVVQGAGEVGAALVDAPCDKISFIGSPATGRRIAEAAAKHLTPVVMELGGKDAAIVCRDADLDLATSGILWGSFLNAGQTCCAVERIFVVEDVAEEFTKTFVEKLSKVRHGGANAEIGSLTVKRQLDTVERHVDDAIDKGANVLWGGPPKPANQDGSLWYPPTVLGGMTPNMALAQEEIFGPVVPIIRVADEEEAVKRTNEEGFNLTSSVWSRSRAKAEALASKIRAGTVSINEHADTLAAPWTPWGGVGESGYGRLNGVGGLREFTVPVHVARNLTPRLKRLWWYPYDAATVEALRGIAAMVSSPGFFGKFRGLRQLLGNIPKALKAKI